MNFNEYQVKTRGTDVGASEEHGLKPPWVYYVLGIAGETGELVEKIKKLFRDDYGQMTEKKKDEIIKEAGDILWYLARLLDFFDINFNDIAEENIRKLLDRKKRNKLHGSGDDR